MELDSEYGGITLDQFNAKQEEFKEGVAKTLDVENSSVSLGSVTETNSSARRNLNTNVVAVWNVVLTALENIKIEEIIEKVDNTETFNNELELKTEAETGLDINEIVVVTTKSKIFFLCGKLKSDFF